MEYRKQLLKLSIFELKKQYRGSVLSWVWGIIRPAFLIFTFWFAFTIGLRSGQPKNGYPFFLWLIAGMIPWYYMRDMISQGSNSIKKYTFLVTKLKYPISTIPTFISLTFMMVYLVLTVAMVVIFWLFGFPPTKYMLQIPFYWGLMFLFFTAWGLFASMLTIVSRDFYNLIRSLTQALFWLSGIIYDASRIEHDWIRRILMCNPITICVNGFRNAMVYNQWFWEDWSQLRNLAILYVILCGLAVWAYKKLYKDIPDIL